MTDFGNYITRKAEKERAFERLNYAGAALELAQIKERLAEIASQHEPLASLCDNDQLARDRVIAAATYVVTGRKP